MELLFIFMIVAMFKSPLATVLNSIASVIKDTLK